MNRLVVYVVGLLISVFGMLNSNPASPWFSVSSGIAIGFLIPLIDAIIVHLRFLKIVWYSIRTWRSHVRISAAYLYRIKIDNAYLLVQGKRFDQYQPVGGVYKAYTSSSGKRNDMGILDDRLLEPDEVSEGDLRVRVPGKNLVSFVRWFETGRGRETDGWREFYEELLATGILSESAFRFIKYDRIQRIYRPLRFSEWAQSQELLIADIFELIPTDDQLVELRQLRTRTDPRFLWASENQIRRFGAADDSPTQTTRIAQTAVWTIDA